MPTLKDWNFGGPTNLLPSPVQDCQRSINLYPEIGGPGSKSPVGLTGRPGLSLLNTLPTSPVRALWPGANSLYAVAGTHVYNVNPVTGNVITDYGAIPGSSGFGPAQIVYDSKNAAGDLLVCDPSVSGGTVVRVDTMAQVWTASFIEYLDGFIFAVTTGSNQAVINQANASNLLDGFTWQTLSYIQRTGSSDLLIGLAMVNGLLWLFGQKNTEIWYDAGNLGFPCARIQGGQLNVGCLAAATIIKAFNTVAWIGADERGWGRVYMANGTSPDVISTPAIEQMINGFNSGGNSAGSPYGFSYSEAGHLFLVWIFPFGTVYGYNTSPSLGVGLVYDVTTKMWSEWAYNNSGQLQLPLHGCFASLNYTGTPYNYVGDNSSGNLYLQSLAYHSDNGTAIKRVRVGPAMPTQNRFAKFSRFELDADIGTASPVVDYSDDGGRTFKTSLARTLTKSTNQAVDGFGRYFGMQWGRSRDRRWRMTITDANNPINIINAYVDAEEGTEE